MTTRYPEAPSTTLELRFNATEAKTVMWKLDWVDDPTSVTWTAVPSTGLARRGESITVGRRGGAVVVLVVVVVLLVVLPVLFVMRSVVLVPWRFGDWLKVVVVLGVVLCW